jgi:FKBP-type peptidyl-prolyl cis-trans isomerase
MTQSCQGHAQVIQGWEIALRSMTVGEVAMVYVRNAYSYSTDGMRLKGLLPYTGIRVIAPA